MTACETDAVTFGKMTRALSASQILVPGTVDDALNIWSKEIQIS